MAMVVRCPNLTCGRTSHLGEDPLGRIFRCPRCLTKLPTAEAASSDSGWTAVLGPLPRRAPARCSEPAPRAAVHHHTAAVGGWESAYGLVAFEPEGHGPWNPLRHADLCAQESGEVHVGSFEPAEWWADDQAAHGPRGPASPGAAPILRPRPAEADSSARPVSRRLSRFEIVEVIGEGRHATVYRAFDPLLDRQIALKLPRPGSVLSARSLQRFLGEARALARLTHPRIVPIFEAGCDGGMHYIAMALVEGCSLADLVVRGPLPFRRSAGIIAEIAEALGYAHALGIIHRDVKPANVRLDHQGQVYLMDFGIAYRPDSGEEPSPPGTIVGTPAYLAPEQINGGQFQSLAASDQYSLGAVFYELLCGKPPFLGPPPAVLLHASQGILPSLQSVEPRVPRTLAAICQKAMARQPERRYGSCQALADDLRQWLRDETPSAYRRAWNLFL